MPTITPRETALAVLLIATAGFLDAVGFLELGGYFVSFMSGNSTRMSVEAVGHEWGGAGKALGLIGVFFVGTVAGAAIERFGNGRFRVLASASVLVGLAAAASSWMHWLPFPPILIVAVAMGVLNATFLHDGEVSVGLTYMTGTLVKAGQHLADALFGGPRWRWLRYLSRWAALAVGAVLGAWTFTELRVGALWIACALLCALAAATGLVRRVGTPAS